MNPISHTVGGLLALSNKRRSRRAGFSLIEVVLSIGIVAFAFIALLGLLPTGLKTFRNAVDTSLGAQIGQKVVSDLQESEFDDVVTSAGFSVTSTGFQGAGPPTALPFSPAPVKPPQNRYFNDQGNEVFIPSDPQGNSVPTQQQRTQFGILYDVHTQIAWPGQLPAQGAGGSTGETIPSPSLANIRVQVISNPTGLTYPAILDSSVTAHFTTFTGVISRNGKNPPIGN